MLDLLENRPKTLTIPGQGFAGYFTGTTASVNAPSRSKV